MADTQGTSPPKKSPPSSKGNSPPKGNSPSSKGNSPPAEAPFIEAAQAEQDDRDDADSALGEEGSVTTASIASSIFEYRTIKGRTFHSERHSSEYFTPNDDRQMESIDISHHHLTLLLEGKLYLAPIEKNVARVLDVGTGSGIWAIDFADENPGSQIIATDLSPVQPTWVPPNLKFEIDDCTQPWTWPADTFDYVHMRLLFGAIADWPALYRQAFRCCRPGGWLESAESELVMTSDDGTAGPHTTIGSLWGRLFAEAGKKLGLSFTVYSDGLQRRGMEEAGFVDIQETVFKIPIGGWPRDPRLAEVGRYSKFALENDLEGYSLYLWSEVLGWPEDEYQIFLMMMRKELRSKDIHPYVPLRHLCGRKPEG